jgi:N-ethylmaleimide reductase
MSEAAQFRSADLLLTPYMMDGLTLANRVVMAPLTRSRATNAELAPTDLHVRYYTQRASARLIISEALRHSGGSRRSR